MRLATWLVLMLVRWAASQPGMGPGGMPLEAKPVFKTQKLIECAACREATRELWEQVTKARAEAPKQTLDEDALQGIAEALCDPDGDGGEWITYFDVVQSDVGAPLKLEKQEYVGECRRECRTLAKACSDVYDEVRIDVAEALYDQPSLSKEKLVSRVCTKWAKKCPQKQTPDPDYSHPDEWWMPVDEEMYRMKKMQQIINKQANKYGKQPVQFVDPMASAMFMDEDEEL